MLSNQQTISYRNLIFVCTGYFIAVCLCSCSPKLHYPVEEIQRSLSLPPKNWGVSLGLGPGYYHSKASSFFYTAGMANVPYGYLSPVFWYPYLPINDRLELHFTFLNVKYYPIKNTKIVDSALCINGLNLAVGGGLNGLIFTSDGKMLVPVDFFEQFKCPINKHNWIFSTGRIDYNQLPDINSKDEFSADAVIGTGFQITRKLYTTLSIGAFYYKTTQEYLVPFDVYSETIEGYSLRLPMQWGYNLNKKWKLFLYGDVSYQTPRAITTSWALGSDFYW